MKKIVRILNDIRDVYIEIIDDACLYENVLRHLKNGSDKLGWGYLYKSVLETWPHFTGDFDNPIPNPANSFNNPRFKWWPEFDYDNGVVMQASAQYRWDLLDYFIEVLTTKSKVTSMELSL